MERLNTHTSKLNSLKTPQNSQLLDMRPWMERWINSSLSKDDFRAICLAAKQATAKAKEYGRSENTMEILSNAITAAQRLFGADDCSVALLYLELSDCFYSQGDTETGIVFEAKGLKITQHYLQANCSDTYIRATG